MKKLVSIVMVVALLSLVFTGCNPGTKTSAQPPKDTQIVFDEQKAIDIQKTVTDMVAQNKKPFELVSYIDQNIKYLNVQYGAEVVGQLVKVLEDYESQYNEDFFKENTQELLNQYFLDGFDIQKLDAIKEDSLKSFLKELLDGGYKILPVEGSYMTIVDFEILKKYNDYISPELKEYIALMAEQSNNPAAMDAGLLISWDELAKRAAATESYLKLYPDSPRKDNIDNLYKGYLVVYLSGMDNTPAFDMQTQILLEDVKKSYENTITQYKGSQFAKIVDDYMKLLEKEGFMNTENVMNFVMNLNQQPE